MRQQFKQTVMDLALKDSRIVLIFGDVSVYLFKDFSEKYPGKFYNMGICENTLISAAAGLSSRGLFPFIHTIAPFITERSFEQIKLDMCYNQFGGNIVSCGASFDYAWDGATHHSYYDLALLRLLPNIEVIQPGSKKELDILLRSQYNNGITTYYRLSDYPHTIDIPVEFGKGVIIKDSSSPLTVMTAGPLLGNVFDACKDLEINLVYFHTIKPIDKDLILKFKNTDIIVIHDAFGLYESICEVSGLSVSYHGLRDEYCSAYGKINDAHRCLGLDPESINIFIKKRLKALNLPIQN
jgi:transketolase